MSRSTELVEPELLASAASISGSAGCGGSAVSGGAEVDVAGDGDHLGRDGEVVGGGLDLAARAGAHVGVGVLGGGDDAVEVAEALEQRRRGLLADTGHAGQAVGGVAAQGGEVGVLAGGDAVLVADPVVGHPLVLADAAGGVEDPHAASSSTSWNRSRSPVTTSTGSAGPVASVPITSSAS